MGRRWLSGSLPLVFACTSGGLRTTSSGPAPEAGLAQANRAVDRATLDPEYVRGHFDELLLGTWLVGPVGEPSRRSWIRFGSHDSGVASWGGNLAVLGDPSLPAVEPYWACSGSSRWQVTARVCTVDLPLDPLGCAREVLVFESFHPVSPPGPVSLEAAIIAAKASPTGWSESTPLVGLKYSDDACNPSFTACSPPKRQ